MTQIQHSNALFNGASPLGAGAPSRKEGSQAGSAGTPPFAQWLTQSSQQMIAPVTPPAAAMPTTAPKAPAAPTPPQQRAAKGPEGTASQDEQKLSARNAARQQANRAAEAPKPSAKPAALAGRPDAAAADAASGPEAAEAKTATAAESTERVAQGEQAEDRAEDHETDGATASPMQQILALLRGEAPAEAKSVRGTAATGDGEEGGHSPLAGHAQAGGGAKRHDPSALAERQQLERELSQSARGATDGDAQAEALQATSSGAHEMALADAKPGSTAPPQNFESMLAAAQQASAPGATGSADAPTRTESPNVPLAQPMDGPEFAPELSASISLLIKDGIHEAQLQLNPTDMGPVSINIQMDGQQAQVNFHAEQAATREALERSLPDLAAALQGQGVTLAGGGVFAQQSGSQARDGDRSDGGSRRGRGGDADDDGVSASARPERRTAPRGLVDLYA